MRPGRLAIDCACLSEISRGTLLGSEADAPCRHHAQVTGIRRRLLLTRLLGVGVLVLVLLSGSRWAIHGPGVMAEALFAVGLMVAVAGFLGRLWALCHVGDRKKRELVTTGPYSMCRHPLYFFSLVGGVGLALCTERLAVAAFFLLVCVVFLPACLRSEERYLEERFAAYAEYRRAVPALLPRWSLLRNPELVTVSSRTLRKALLDSAGFLVLLGGLELIEGLQAASLLPHLFLLP